MNNLQRCVKISRIGRPALNRFKQQDLTCAQFKPYRYLNWYISFISNKSRTVILIISDLTVLQKQILDYLSIATSRFLAQSIQLVIQIQVQVVPVQIIINVFIPVPVPNVPGIQIQIPLFAIFLAIVTVPDYYRMKW